MLAHEPDGLGLIPGMHRVEGEKHLSGIVLRHHRHTMTHMRAHTRKHDEWFFNKDKSGKEADVFEQRGKQNEPFYFHFYENYRTVSWLVN